MGNGKADGNARLEEGVEDMVRRPEVAPANPAGGVALVGLRVVGPFPLLALSRSDGLVQLLG